MPNATGLPMPVTRSEVRSRDDVRRLLRDKIEEAVAEYLAQYHDSVVDRAKRLLTRGRDDDRDEAVRDVSKFFLRSWFTHRNFFLFRKNLRVTNIQLAELLALMRTHVATDVDGVEDIHRLQFLSLDDLLPLFEGLLNDLGDIDRGKKLGENEISAATEQLAPLLARTVAIDRFHGSCVAFLPPFLRFDLERICGEAGYVHSCGHVVYVRNIEKTSKLELIDRLDAYLDQLQPPLTLPIRLNVYTHDDYTQVDRLHEAELRHGLDSVKLYLDKFHIDNAPLSGLLPELEKKFAGRLVITGPPGHDDPRAEVEASHSLWLIADKSIGAALSGFGRAPRYVICYDQWWRNRNPLHVLDEDKPAWVAPVTIPHALLGAMLNVTQPWLRQPNEVVQIADPFVGTGGTVLECLKFAPSHVFCSGSDIDPMCEILVRDNAEILGGDSTALQQWIGLLDQIQRGHKGQEPIGSLERTNMQASLRDLENRIAAAYKLSRSVKIGSEEGLAPRVCEKLQRQTIEERFVFYLMLRTRTKHHVSIARGQEAWGDALKLEARRVKSQMTSLHRLKVRLEGGVSGPQGDEPAAEVDGPEGGLKMFVDDWSLGTGFGIRPEQVGNRVERRSVTQLSPGTFDVILADPPYGYNTKFGPAQLAALYRNAFDAMLRALKPEGQLVVALPDQSFSGRTTPTFIHKEFCIRQVLALAEDQGRQVYVIADAFPSARIALSPPYYWESERALRRAILHFRVRDRPANQVSRLPVE